MSTINASNFVYVQFCAQLITSAKAQGYVPQSADTESGLPQNEGYCFLRFGSDPNSAALIIPKGKTRLGNLHSHVDLTGQDGFIALPKKNGRVICHFAPDLTKVSKVIKSFVGASKRDIVVASSKTPVLTVVVPVSNPLLADISDEELETLAPLPAPSWADMDESEIEDAMQSVGSL